MKKLMRLNSFALRIIALITMTIDHIGVCLSFNNFYILRIIGRIALPLFIFLTVQGALKTSNLKKYLLRVGALAIITGIALAIFSYMGEPFRAIGLCGNIFLDLLLIIISIAILESPNKKIKPLIALPILYSIFTFIVMRLEGCGCDGIYMWLFPPFRMQSGYYGLLMGLGFYAAKKYAPIFINKYAIDHVDDAEYEQMVSNLFSLVVLLFSVIIFVAICFSFGDLYYQPIDSVQTYALLAGLFIPFYNGKRGYNAKWFKVAYYLYYPLHIAIIGLIMIL